MLIGARFIQGDRRRARLGGDPGDDRDDVPGAARAGESDRRLRLRRLRRRLDRPARSAASSPRRSAGTGSSSSTCRSASPPPAWRCAWSRTATGIGLERGRRLPRRRADHRLADARRLHDPRRSPSTAGARPRRSASAPSRWPCWRAFILRQARIANPLMPLRLFRSRNVAGANVAAGAAGRRDVRDVLPRRPLPAAGARLRRARGRPRLPADDGRDGRRSRSASRKS